MDSRGRRRIWREFAPLTVDANELAARHECASDVRVYIGEHEDIFSEVSGIRGLAEARPLGDQILGRQSSIQHDALVQHTPYFGESTPKLP